MSSGLKSRGIRSNFVQEFIFVMRSADPEVLLLPIIGDDQTNTEGREEQSLNNATMHKSFVMQSIDRRPSMQQLIKNLDKHHFAQTKASHPLQLYGVR